jgi:hypothetical protein
MMIFVLKIGFIEDRFEKYLTIANSLFIKMSTD